MCLGFWWKAWALAKYGKCQQNIYFSLQVFAGKFLFHQYDVPAVFPLLLFTCSWTCSPRGSGMVSGLAEQRASPMATNRSWIWVQHTAAPKAPSDKPKPWEGERGNRSFIFGRGSALPCPGVLFGSRSEHRRFPAARSPQPGQQSNFLSSALQSAP